MNGQKMTDNELARVEAEITAIGREYVRLGDVTLQQRARWEILKSVRARLYVALMGLRDSVDARKAS